MKRMLAGFNANSVIIMVVSGLLCWMQARVLNAVYRLPAIEEQIIQFKVDVIELRKEIEDERKERREADREKDLRIRQMENKVGRMP